MQKRNFNFLNLAQIPPYVGSSYQNDNFLNFLHNGKWVKFSAQEFADNVKNLTLGLKEIGLEKNNSFAILSCSNPLWLMMDFASISAGAISVPIFSNISKENLIFEIENAEIQFIFCDNLEVFKTIKSLSKNFQKIIIYGFETDDKEVIEFEDLILIGKKYNQKNPDLYEKLIADLKENDLATIVYTSGSTGVPKGVEITHKNLISQIQAAAKLFPFDQKTDISLSFLPLAHIFERMIASYYITAGISIYFADDVKNVGNLLREIKPTVLTVVPRMLEKVYGKIRVGVDEGGLIKKIIGKAAIKLALNINPKNCSIFKKIFDLLVYKKLRNSLGGKVRMMICGGAALQPELDRFFKNIGVNLFVGYGTTETSPVIAVNYEGHNKVGTIGPAFPGITVKIAEDGELLAKGPNIMRGYHKDEVKTKEVFAKGDAKGDYNEDWFKTGDLATIDNDGFIKIIGRKKELFKTSGGKYVSPVPIEQKLVNLGEFFLGACVIAEGKKFISCILLTDFEMLEKYKKKIGMANMSDDEFLKSDFINQKIQNIISQVNSGLNHWEQIQKYYLAKDAVSIETGELTPSMKLKRNVIEKKYQKEIEDFYKE